MHPIDEFEQAIGLKGAIYLIQCNGAYIPGNEESAKMLEKCGLNPDNRFLSYDLLLKHVSLYGYCLETDAE